MDHEGAEDDHPSPSPVRGRRQLLLLIVLLPLLACDDRHGNRRRWCLLLFLFFLLSLTDAWSWAVKGTVVHVQRTPHVCCCFQRYRNATERRRPSSRCSPACASAIVRRPTIRFRRRYLKLLLLLVYGCLLFVCWWLSKSSDNSYQKVNVLSRQGLCVPAMEMLELFLDVRPSCVPFHSCWQFRYKSVKVRSRFLAKCKALALEDFKGA